MRRVLGEDAADLDGAAVSVAELDALERSVLATVDLPRPSAGIIDAHCHLGRDADGHRLSAPDLVEDLDRHGVASAVCFPADDPGPDGGFGAVNAAVIAAAKRAPERLIPFCRVDPRADAGAALHRASDGGARGLKLHPVAQRFALDDPAAIGAVRLAAEFGWPTLIHAGFGARPVAEATRLLLRAVPDARLILAHGGRGDARAIAGLVGDDERVLLDTSLATLSDLVLNRPARLCFGTDRPYGDVATGLQLVARAAEVAAWSPDDVRGVLGDNLRSFLR